MAYYFGIGCLIPFLAVKITTVQYIEKALVLTTRAASEKPFPGRHAGKGSPVSGANSGSQ